MHVCRFQAFMQGVDNMLRLEAQLGVTITEGKRQLRSNC